MLLTEQQEREQDINAAEDVFMVGRFVDYDGAETSTPSFRFGNISILDAKIEQETGFRGRSVVVDMHSRTGYSGSPVFVYRTAGSRFIDPGLFVGGGHTLAILGIHWGQFPERWEIKDKSSNSTKSAAEQASLIKDGKYVDGLSGMTCVVPAAAIIKLLDHPELKAMRDQNEQMIAPQMALKPDMPKPEAENKGAASAPTDNNTIDGGSY